MHLSRLAPSGPRPYHVRVVSALLEDASARSEGQLYRLGNGDLALLFRPSDNGTEVAGLMETLLKGSVADPARLRSVWTLPDEAAPALHYVRVRTAEPKRAAQTLDAARVRLASAMGKLAQEAPLESMFVRQTGIVLRPGHRQRIAPMFREIAASTPLLDGRITGTEQTDADPFLAGHFAAQLDRRLLTALAADIAARGPLSGSLAGAGLHINLTLSAVLSKEFALFMDASGPAVAEGLRFAVEVPLVEIFADPKGFLLAQERLRLATMSLVLDGVGAEALGMLRPAELGLHLVKLTWSPALTGAGPELLKAVQRLGVKRIVIDQADTETAVVWGLGQGIQLFQGRYVDTMLAADRLRACPSAASCTLRECSGRAAAIKPAGRSGCGNLKLLDAGMTPGLAEA